MGMTSPENIVKRIFDAVTEKETTVHQVVCKTGFDHRTVKKYLEMIIEIQKSKQVKKTQVGLRFLFKLEKNGQ